ncbi:MAG TPA: HD domain-containing phosphohydrolase, partial [Thermoanaerobaculia bacterium]|nr:HD domain-containing phosphohydrolase [Thermoanaerobaculia bacterium]
MRRASREELALLTALSRALGVRALYPGNHPSVAEAAERVVACLQGCLASRGTEEVTFLALEGEVFLDDRPLRSETLHLTPFVRTLERLGIQRLTLAAGLTVDEAGALVAALASAGELPESPCVEVGRVRVAGTVGGGPGVGPGSWAGAGGPGGPGSSGAGAAFGEGLLDRAEEVLGGFARTERGAAGRLDDLVWQLIEGLGATSRSFLLLAPIRSADRAFFVHSLHVALLALAQARSLGLSGITLHEIGVAAMLHDLGKLSLPQALRERRGRLSDRDWEEMKLHPELGAARLAATEGVPRLALLVAYEHHLRWDGKPSFPRPARPRTPNLASQITAVADTWDVLVSDRHATPGAGRQAAIEAWRRRAGTWLDPFLVG